MNKFHKELNWIADRINKADFLCYEIAINRRNGYYAVDKYQKDGTFEGAMYVGSYKETECFLKGLHYGFFYLKPF